MVQSGRKIILVTFPEGCNITAMIFGRVSKNKWSYIHNTEIEKSTQTAFFVREMINLSRHCCKKYEEQELQHIGD